MEGNTNRGLTKVQKSRINYWESRDLKHSKISLVLWDALMTILLIFGEKETDRRKKLPRSVQDVTTNGL